MATGGGEQPSGLQGAAGAPLPSTAGTDRDVVLHRDTILGVGSYGRVCRAEYRGVPCAAKLMHSTLFAPPATSEVPQDRQHRTPYARFLSECEVLRQIRHPNIIQYLHAYSDLDNDLPGVLLLELMETSLTAYLDERRQRAEAVPYRVEVNICHNITQALVFLHGRADAPIIHRDLSGKNVLLRGLPQNITAKVTDFGMARLGDECRSNPSLTLCPGTNVYMPPEALQDRPHYTDKIDCFSFGVLVVQILTKEFPQPGDRRIVLDEVNERRVREVDRRRNHIRLIDGAHPLRPIAFSCLEDNPVDRPSAQELSQRIANVKQAPHYVESDLNSPWCDVQARHGRHQSRSDRQRLVQNEARRPQEHIRREQQSVCGREEAHLQLTWMRGESAPCKPFRWCDAIISGTTVYFRQGGLGHLHTNYSYDCISRQWNLLPSCPLGHPTLTVIDCQLTAIGNKDPLSNQLLTLQETGRHGDRQWVTRYPSMPTKRYLTTALCTETSLIVAGGIGEGRLGQRNWLLKTVEVMDIGTQVWSTAADLLLPLTRCSVSLCGDCVYVLGGLTVGQSSPSVLTCSLRSLLESCGRSGMGRYEPGSGVWSRVADLPVCDSTCVTVHGRLLAIGGKAADTNSASSAVRVYKTSTDTWEIIGHMNVSRFKPFAVVLPSECVMVVGGAIRDNPNFTCTNEVEFATFAL